MILTFLISGVVFIPLGAICLFASQGVCLIFFSFIFFTFLSNCGYDFFFNFCSYMKVIEIVDRYDTDCIPLSSRDNKVRYIQGLEDKRCNRTIMVDISIIFSSWLLAILNLLN